MAKLDETELKALLSAELSASLNYDRSELSAKRAKAMELYRGVVSDLPSMVGRSKMTSRDVADTIGWMLPGIIRVFTASQHMACYEPQKEEDEQFADYATAYVNHVFWKDNDGYRILWDSTHDSLLMGNGIVKHWWDDTPEYEQFELSGVTQEGLVLLEDEKIEIVAQKDGQPQFVPMQDPATGQVVEVEVPAYDLKVRRVVMNGRMRIECIEPENFFMDKDARFIEEARFVAHRDEVTRSDLIEMGFDRDIVEGLPTDRSGNFSEESLEREEDYIRNWNRHDATQLIELFECYIRVDIDGDGIAEMVRAYYAGTGGAGELLDWEVWEDDVPFSDIPCEPQPHRWDARSVTDETKDIQIVKTALTRQFMDNTYASNLPMLQAETDTVVNPEMLINPKFGGVIWRKKGTMATSPVLPIAIPYVADKTLVALQHFDNVTEKRTGVSRATMALDPQTLQNQTATASQNQKDAAYSQIELIARNQAELGWTRVFRQLLKLICKHQDMPRKIRFGKGWETVTPQAWNADMHVTVNVGLGTGSRDRDMAMLEKIGMNQAMLTERFAASGMFEEALDMLPRIVNTLKKQAESAGLRMPDEFFPEFDDQKIAELKQAAQQRAQQPDPKVVEAQKKIELEAVQGQAKLQLEYQKQQGDLVLKREQLAQELLLKREQLAAELALKRELAMMEMSLKDQSGYYKPKPPNVTTSKVSMGGQPG